MITQTALDEEFSIQHHTQNAIGKLIVADMYELEDQFVRRRRRLRRAEHGDKLRPETQLGNGFMAIDCLVWDVVASPRPTCEKRAEWPECRK